MTKYKETRFFILLNYTKLKAHLIQSYIHLAINIFKAIYNYPTNERFIFCVYCHAFNNFIFTLLGENRKRSLILNDVVPQ